MPNARKAATAVFSPRYPEFSRLSKVFESAGIDRRFGVRPIEWYLQTSNWPDRNAVYIESASQLFVKAAKKALCDAGLSAADIDVIVTVSTTGIATPSLEARVTREMGFRDDVERVPVFGLGCAGGVSGLALAACRIDTRLRGVDGCRRHLYPCVSHGQTDQSERRCDGAVRGWSCSMRSARRRNWYWRRRNVEPAHVARHHRHYGLDRGAGWPGRGL